MLAANLISLKCELSFLKIPGPINFSGSYLVIFVLKKQNPKGNACIKILIESLLSSYTFHFHVSANNGRPETLKILGPGVDKPVDSQKHCSALQLKHE